MYQKQTKSWEQVTIKDRQFLFMPLKNNDEKEGHEYGIYNARSGDFLFPCQYWFKEEGIAHCGNENDYHFKFSRGKNRTGKFILGNLDVEYLFGSTDSAPNVGIGTCIQVD